MSEKELRPIPPEEEPVEEQEEDDELLDFGRNHETEKEQFGDPTDRKRL